MNQLNDVVIDKCACVHVRNSSVITPEDGSKPYMADVLLRK